MMRVLTFSAIAAAAFSIPAMAESQAGSDQAKSEAFGAALANGAAAEQARLQLAHQGYTGISPLDRDEQGRWVGTAIKDGKTVFVAVVLPRIAHGPVTD